METPGLIVQTSHQPDFYRLEGVSGALVILGKRYKQLGWCRRICKTLSRKKSSGSIRFPPLIMPPDEDDKE